MVDSKATYDQTGRTTSAAFHEEQSTEMESLARKSPGNTVSENVPHYFNLGAEEVINHGNSWIVLGQDRPRSVASGKGGQSYTGAHAVDIVAGRMAPTPLRSHDGKNVWVDNMYVNSHAKNEWNLPHGGFICDAARVLVVEKTDVDRNFNLAKGSGEARGGSAVVAKADDIRLAARNGIKLITGVDSRKSIGAARPGHGSGPGIDLIAGNKAGANLEPIVKGNRLVSCLNQIIEQIVTLNNVVSQMAIEQAKLNIKTGSHFHYSPFFAQPTTISPPLLTQAIQTNVAYYTKIMMSLLNQGLNIAGKGQLKTTYLTPSGGKWICSRKNRVN